MSILDFYRQTFTAKTKRKLDPILRKIYMAYCVMTGRRYSNSGIGAVKKIPRRSKTFRKISFAQQGEDLILDRILNNKLNFPKNYTGRYIDIGAYHPVNHSVTYLLYLRGWRGIACDPSKKTMESYRHIRPQDDFFNCLVGKNDSDDVNFYIHDENNGDSSLINTKYPKKKHEYKVIKVPQRGINSIFGEVDLNTIDIVNIDVEGAELEIIQSWDFSSFRPSIIIIEIHEKDVNRGLKTKVALELIENGYSCVGVAVITYFFLKEK